MQSEEINWVLVHSIFMLNALPTWLLQATRYLNSPHLPPSAETQAISLAHNILTVIFVLIAVSYLSILYYIASLNYIALDLILHRRSQAQILLLIYMLHVVHNYILYLDRKIKKMLPIKFLWILRELCYLSQYLSII